MELDLDNMFPDKNAPTQGASFNMDALFPQKEETSSPAPYQQQNALEESMKAIDQSFTNISKGNEEARQSSKLPPEVGQQVATLGAAASPVIAGVGFTADIAQRLGRVLNLTPDQLTPEKFHEMMTTGDPTVAQKAQDWLKKNAPAFAAGADTFMAPISAGFSGAQKLFGTTVANAMESQTAGNITEDMMAIAGAIEGARGILKGKPKEAVKDETPSTLDLSGIKGDLAEGAEVPSGPVEAPVPKPKVRAYATVEEVKPEQIKASQEEAAGTTSEILHTMRDEDIAPEIIAQAEQERGMIPEDEPMLKLPEGHVRLYRGSREPQRSIQEPPEGSPMSAYTEDGRWFSVNRDTAEMYAGKNGHVYYVDVPKEVFDENRPTETGHWLEKSASLLPHDYANKAREIGRDTESIKGKPGGAQAGVLNLDAFFPEREEGKDPEITKLVMGLDARNTPEFMDDVRTKFPDNVDENGFIEYAKGEDVSAQWGATTSSFRSSNALLGSRVRQMVDTTGKITYDRTRNLDQLAERVLKFFDDKLKLSQQYEHSLNYANQKILESYNNYYGMGVGKALTFKKSLFKDDVKTRLGAEADSSKWFNGTSWFPTKEQYIEMGMSDPSARMWVAVDSALEKAWHIAEQAAKYAGHTVPGRVPGYLPHIFKGAYRVVVMDPKGERYLASYYSNTRAEAKKSYEYIKQQLAKDPNHKNNQVELREPSAWGKGTHDMLQGLHEAFDIFQNGKNTGLKQILKGMYESNTKGIVSAILDRNNVTQKGHLLDRVNEKGELGLTDKQMRQAHQSVFESIEAMHAWYARVKFINDTLIPLEGVGALSARNLRKVATDYMETYFKVPQKLFEQSDAWIKDQFIKAGLNPASAHILGRMSVTAFAKYYLFYKPSFWIANSFQQMLALPYLHSVKALGQAMGEKHGSITRALVGLSKDMGSLYKGAHLDFAREKGFTDPVFMENLDPTKWRDPVSNYIEKMTRINTFSVGYHYFKQFMNEEDARNAAGEFANTVSVPYSKHLGQPTIMKKLPVALKPMVMFATYNQHMLGLMSQQAHIVSIAMENKKPTAMFNSTIGGLIGTQALQYSLFGLAGITFMQNIDSLIKGLNKALDWNVSGPTEWARKMKSIGQDQIARFGMVSKMLGYDVSTSGTGATINMPIAGYDAFKSLLSTVGIYAKSAFQGTTPTRQELYEQVKQMPAHLQTPFEYMLKNKQYDASYIKQLMNQEGDWAPKPHDVNEKMMARSYVDTLMRHLGLKSLVEKSEIDTMGITDADRAIAQRDAKHQEQRIAEGDRRPETIQRILDDKKMPSSIISAQKTYAGKVGAPDEEARRGMTARTLEQKQWYLEYLKNKAQAPYNNK